MLRKMRNCKGQGLLEYTVLIALVLSALLLMATYVRRAYSGRLKQEADTISPSQYSPRHTTALIESTVTTNTDSYMGVNGAPDGVTLTFSNSSTTFDRREAVDGLAGLD